MLFGKVYILKVCMELLALVGLLALATLMGCSAPEDAFHQHLHRWGQTLERSAWSCDAMGVQMDAWLQRNQSALAGEVKVLVLLAGEFEGDEREVFLNGLVLPPKGQRALGKCLSEPLVRSSFDKMSVTLSPLLLLESNARVQRPIKSSPIVDGSPLL